MRSAVSTVNEVSARALAPSATHATTSAHERSATFADILLGGRSRVLLPDMAPRGRGSAVAWRSGFRGGVEWLDDGSLASRFEASARGKWAGRARYIFSCFVAKRASTRNKPAQYIFLRLLHPHSDAHLEELQLQQHGHRRAPPHRIVHPLRGRPRTRRRPLGVLQQVLPVGR